MDTLITLPFDELNENEFKLGKYHYISKDCEYDSQNACDLCAFGHEDRKCLNSPPCDWEDRNDGRDVYYVEVIEQVF